MNDSFEYGFSNGFSHGTSEKGQGVIRCHVPGRSATPEAGAVPSPIGQMIDAALQEMQTRFEQDASEEIDLALPATTRLQLKWSKTSETSCTADRTYGIYVITAREDSPRWISNHYHDSDLDLGEVDPFICNTLIEAMVACEQHFDRTPIPGENSNGDF